MGRGAIYILVLLLWSISARAIDNRYVFKKLNNEDGLTYNTVHDIAQEESGIIWFATKQGLNKYDSYNIRRYYTEDGVGIPSNFITSIFVTKNNRLFVGTDRGAIEYNRRFDRFEPVLFEGNTLPGITTLLRNFRRCCFYWLLPGNLCLSSQTKLGNKIYFASERTNYINS
ncbi:two-component regulator propeller domain-containing protein [uncultured Draconibacterium sp.]|uniref:two-component regulator propeller domain-containing protein n=1 Tax=uncultured Draconibacterium sp. TaxID=1573823 RepID=UPI003216A3F3